MMRLGIEGKMAGWWTLRARAADDSRLDKDRFDALLTRGRRQAAQVDRLRELAVAEAFGGEVDPAEVMRGVELDRRS